MQEQSRDAITTIVNHKTVKEQPVLNNWSLLSNIHHLMRSLKLCNIHIKYTYHTHKLSDVGWLCNTIRVLMFVNLEKKMNKESFTSFVSHVWTKIFFWCFMRDDPLSSLREQKRLLVSHDLKGFSCLFLFCLFVSGFHELTPFSRQFPSNFGGIVTCL